MPTSWNGYGVFTRREPCNTQETNNLRLEKLLTALFAAALGASFIAPNPVKAQQLTPTPEEVIQDLLNKCVPMEQIERMMEQAEPRRGRRPETQMKSRLKDEAVAIEGEGLVCTGRTCDVATKLGFSVASPMSTPAATRKLRVCGTITGKLQYC